MSSPSPLLLFKLTATLLTGIAAALSFRRLHRRHLLSYLRLHILTSINNPADVRPPSLLIVGFKSHGRSALVNTICRVLAAEVGPLVVRSEVGSRHVIRADVAGEEEGEGGGEVEIVEGVEVPEKRGDVKRVLVGSITDVDCVVAVVRCGVAAEERRLAVKRVGDVARVVRERGLHLVVVLTQKKALRSKKQAEKLRREVTSTVRTDCVYFIENYTPTSALNVDHPIAIKNNFETHLTVLTIVRQCIEFARLRTIPSRKASALPDPSDTSLVKEQ